MNIYKQIYDNNIDLLERVKDENLDISCLQKDDVLLMNIGEFSVDYDSLDIDELMTVHYDPETYKIIGFTIPYWKEFLKELAFLKKPREEKEEHYKPKPQTIASAGLFSLSLAFA